MVTRVGGRGGFLASVLAIGVVHPPGMKVSAEETVRGGAGGSFLSIGGGTNPGSPVPSPAARQVPAQSVNNSNADVIFFMFSFLSSP